MSRLTGARHRDEAAEADRQRHEGGRGAYVLLNALRPFVIVNVPSDFADTLIQ